MKEKELLEQKLINAASKRMFESIESYIKMEIRKNPSVSLDEIKFQLISVSKPRIIKMAGSSQESHVIEKIITDFIHTIYLNNIIKENEKELN